MDLDTLRKDGVIHIGGKSNDNLIVVLMDPARPGFLCVAHGSQGVEFVEGEPRVAGMEAVRGQLVMICHHYSAREIVAKILEGLEDRQEVDADSQTWVRASFEELIYAYPPFAKIFLSQVPSFSRDRSKDAATAAPEGADEDPEAGAGWRKRRKRKQDGEDLQVREARSALIRLATSPGEMVGMAMILLTLALVGWMSFGQDRPDGGSLLGDIKKLAGLGEEGDLLAEGGDPFSLPSLFEPDFATWYNLDRRNDTGLTMGLPRSSRGYDVRTWVDPLGEDKRIYAAYQYGHKLPPPDLWRLPSGRTDIGRLSAIMRTAETSHLLFRQICQAELATDLDNGGSGDVRPVEVVVAAGDTVVDSFRVTGDACVAGRPRRD